MDNDTAPRETADALDGIKSSVIASALDKVEAELEVLLQPKRVARGVAGIVQSRLAQEILDSEDWEEPPNEGPLDQELAENLPPPAPLVERLAHAGDRVVLVATYKAGKTTLIRNVVRAGADGSPLFGEFAVHDFGNIGYWDAELSKARSMKWWRDMGVENPACVFTAHLRGYDVPLALSVAQDWAVSWLKSRKIRTWIIDPFGAVYPGEENSNSETREWLKALDRVARMAKVENVFLVVHTPHLSDKDPEQELRARGAVRLMDWHDVLWTYNKNPESDSSRRYLRAFGRDVDEPQFTLDYELGSRTLRYVGGKGAYADLVEALAMQAGISVWENWDIKHEPINKTNLEKALGRHNTNYKREAINRAITVGWIRYEEQGKAQLHHPGDTDPRVVSAPSAPIRSDAGAHPSGETAPEGSVSEERIRGRRASARKTRSG